MHNFLYAGYPSGTKGHGDVGQQSYPEFHKLIPGKTKKSSYKNARRLSGQGCQRDFHALHAPCSSAKHHMANHTATKDFFIVDLADMEVILGI